MSEENVTKEGSKTVSEDVIDYLNKFNFSYTNTLYKALKVKDHHGLSLNKFREKLYAMEKLKEIKLVEYQALPCWSRL